MCVPGKCAQEATQRPYGAVHVGITRNTVQRKQTLQSEIHWCFHFKNLIDIKQDIPCSAFS